MHLWQASSEVAASTIFSEVMKVGFLLRTYSAGDLPAAVLATDVGETSGPHNLRPRPTSPEDTMYIDSGRESLNQYTVILVFHSKYYLMPYIVSNMESPTHIDKRTITITIWREYSC